MSEKKKDIYWGWQNVVAPKDGEKRTLTIDDIGAIVDVLRLQDLEYNERFIGIQEYVKKQAVTLERIGESIEAINKRLDAIETSLSDKEKRLVYLENYASWPHTVIRHAVAIFVGLCIGLVIGYVLHSILL